jgi:hypothetical protein
MRSEELTMCLSRPVTVLLSMLIVAGVIGGCGHVRNALPVELMEAARPSGIADVRAWGGEPSELFQRDIVESIRQVRSHSSSGLVDSSGWINVCALSGGGANGAFGSGLLAGWTEAGDRPAFKLVTGVSTGALMAPFVFLGPDYDNTLKEFYTTTRTEHVIKPKSLLMALAGGDSFTDSSPLLRLLERSVTPETLQAIAREHRRGRRLYILTTNLDARRAVVWNMGAIADSDHPGAVELFRKVMRASASIPVAMGPIYIPVEANGKTYDEMHVDGGVTSEVFFYGFMLDIQAAAKEAGVAPGAESKVRIYVIRNSQLRVPYEQVKPRLLPIASRAISSLTSTQGVGDLYRIYTITQRDDIDFNLATIPDSYVSTAKEAFDPEDMARLYELGYELAKKGYPWQKLPPGLTEDPAEPAR